MCCAYYIGTRLAEALSFRKCEIRPSDTAPVIRMGDDGMETALLRFGFPGHEELILNARCETLLEKPLFREHAALRRILVPATGFHEWDPYRKRFTFCSTDGSSLYFAGIHDGLNFLIITTEANESLRGVHDRKPLVLERSMFSDWLSDRMALGPILRSRPRTLRRKDSPTQASLLS